ncbi:VTT domain-containing protein [Streptomyces collinus]|uniref:DedA family protein n=1 Tax=Streptomyces collinus TaxID=42684 RepID=UPI003401F588
MQGRGIGRRAAGKQAAWVRACTAWREAEARMDRHGGRAVFLARFLPVVRTLTPHLAGATRLSYPRITPYSALAALLWAGAEAGIGYAALATVG